jgi:hypothetical protein
MFVRAAVQRSARSSHVAAIRRIKQRIVLRLAHGGTQPAAPEGTQQQQRRAVSGAG